jgi:hypothetical protein
MHMYIFPSLKIIVRKQPVEHQGREHKTTTDNMGDDLFDATVQLTGGAVKRLVANDHSVTPCMLQVLELKGLAGNRTRYTIIFSCIIHYIISLISYITCYYSVVLSDGETFIQV